MNVWKSLNLRVGAMSIAVLLVISGCAQNQLATGEVTSIAANEEKKSEKALAATMAPGEELVTDYAVQNPVPISFDKLSIKLSDGDKKILSQIKERAKKARALTITGYCDRKQVGNAKAAALARARAVKDELVRLGVKPQQVKLKFVTEVANKHAVEIAL